jgi:acetyl esterase/lipase
MSPAIRRTVVALAVACGLAAASAASTAHAQAPSSYPDLEYARVTDRAGAPHALHLDLYLPPGDGPFPVIVWVHGGAWLAGSKQLRPDSEQRRQVGRGYALASVEYRLSSEAQFPAQIHDCKAAVRWLRGHASQFHLDAQHVGVWGASAGGHLAALLGTSGDVASLDDRAMGYGEQSSRVQAVVDWYGPTDFAKMDTQLATLGYGPTQLTHSRPDSPESRLVGCEIARCPEAAAAADPIAYVSRDDPPFCIQHGSADGTVPFGQSTLLYEALRSAGVSARLDLFGDTGHGGAAFTSETNMRIVDAFWDAHLRH